MSRKLKPLTKEQEKKASELYKNSSIIKVGKALGVDPRRVAKYLESTGELRPPHGAAHNQLQEVSNVPTTGMFDWKRHGHLFNYYGVEAHPDTRFYPTYKIAV